MDKNMKSLHYIQMVILRELLFKPNARFSDLNIKGLTSDHFSYHINQLVELKYVSKNGTNYSLTVKGKEFANTMDTDDATVEKQPKVAVIVVVKRDDNGNTQLLMQERTKEPYFGYVGFFTGKVRFGEKILETARREMKEETNLEGGEMFIRGLVHDHVVLENEGKLVEDKLFFVVTCDNPEGELTDTQSGRNFWMDEKDFSSIEKKYYQEDTILKIANSSNVLEFNENTFIVKEF